MRTAAYSISGVECEMQERKWNMQYLAGVVPKLPNARVHPVGAIPLQWPLDREVRDVRCDVCNNDLQGEGLVEEGEHRDEVVED